MCTEKDPVENSSEYLLLIIQILMSDGQTILILFTDVVGPNQVI